MDFLSKVNGITQLLEAISASNGISDASKVIETNSQGVIDNSLISLAVNDLSDTNAPLFSRNTGDTLVWNGTEWIQRRPLMSWIWSSGNRSLNSPDEPTERIHQVPTTNARFYAPVPCTILYAISSAEDNDDFETDIYINGSLAYTFAHPLNVSAISVIPSPAINLNPLDFIYIITRRTGGGSVSDLMVDLYLQERIT